MTRSALSARRSALKRVIGMFHAAHLPKIPAMISSRLPRMLKFRSPDEIQHAASDSFIDKIIALFAGHCLASGDGARFKLRPKLLPSI